MLSKFIGKDTHYSWNRKFFFPQKFLTISLHSLSLSIIFFIANFSSRTLRHEKFAINNYLIGFERADAPLCFCWCSLSIELSQSFDFTETASPQRLHGEGSLSQRRALAVSITSARQQVEFKGTVQSSPKYDSGNPQMRFSQSTRAFLIIPKALQTKIHLWA